MKLLQSVLFAIASLAAIGTNEAWAVELSNVSAAEAARQPSMASLTVAELEARMGRGDLNAQAELGARYGRGDGVTRDVPKAIALLEDAAANNNAEAQHWLATAYATGVGVPKIETKAALLYEKAAEQGHPEALYMMGVLISNGQAGFSASWSGAFPYFWKSADRGFPPAELMLGMIYHEGKGIDANPQAAAYWYRRTFARQQNARAAFYLAQLVGEGLVAWQPGDPVEMPGANLKAAPAADLSPPKLAP